jgi:hypothetical protein
MIDGMTYLGASTADHVGRAAPDRRSPLAPAPRADRLFSMLTDIAWLAAGSIAAFVVAFGFLFWRTGWGAVDAGAGDTAIATALLLAPAPTWLAWLIVSVLDEHASPGQRERGLVVTTTAQAWPGAQLIRLALHPLSLPGWLWLSTITYLLAAIWLSWLFLLVVLVVALTSVGSAILIVIGRRPLHDILGRTNVETIA